MKYKYVHIENGPRCFLYASQYQQLPDTTIFFCIRKNPEFKEKFHYKVYRLFDKKLDGPAFMDAAVDLRFIGLSQQYSEKFSEQFEVALKNEEDVLSFSEVERPKHVQVVPEDEYSGKEVVAENNQKPDKASPNVTTENSYSAAITHFYKALRNRKNDANFLSTCNADDKKAANTLSNRIGGANK